MASMNIDRKTGIRYGVISQHSVDPEMVNEKMEGDYGAPTCPECEGTAKTYDDEKHADFRPYSSYGLTDYACETCGIVLSPDQVFPEEPLGYLCSDGEYEIGDCLDSDLIVTKSPYFTYGLFCSPCVPGAVNLDSAGEGTVKAYCLGHEWFENGKAPYTVYSVETGEIVLSDEEY